MSELKQYIESGVLEMYVMGLLSAAECAEVEHMAALHVDIRAELEEISEALETYAAENAAAPHPAVKPLLMATIDYRERLQNGEIPTFPPVLNEGSVISDYSQWLERPDMTNTGGHEDLFAKIIGFSPEVTSAIVWIRSMAPHEVHEHEFEKFLIVEGTCDITIGDKVHSLVPGDYLSIPLHVGHHVKVTSAEPCKVILQRIAA